MNTFTRAALSTRRGKRQVPSSNDLIDSGAVLDPVFRSATLPCRIYEVLMETHDPPRLTAAKRLYYAARPCLPLWLRWVLQRQAVPRRLAADWYITTRLLSAYAAAGVALEESVLSTLWPPGHRTALVLTHDVETAKGQAHVRTVADMEEALGFRSSWNFVPYLYNVGRALLRELDDRGFEIGIHGYNHDGLLYSSRREFDRRATAINRTATEWKATGFRSPQVHRNLAWLQTLQIGYDASCFDVDPFQPMPGGCGSLWPFEVGRFVEIPYTLPQDHTLFVVLRAGDNSIWKRKTEWLARHHGMACLITHPDYLLLPATMAHYRDYLEYMQNRSGVWRVLPRDLAAYWRGRNRAAERPSKPHEHDPRRPPSARA
jgi:peptidoglycan/xylan/chitin deacetylase (PgdA/CDA1 family)